jgi:hypothetical protein
MISNIRRLLIHPHPLMRYAYLRIRLVVFHAALVSVFLSPQAILAQSETASADTENKNKGASIKLICVRTLTGNEEEAILASKTEKGNWIEHGNFTLRSPFITSWLTVRGGMTHLIRKEGNEMKSIGSFAIPPQSERSIVILVPDTEKNLYRAQVIDPGKLGFKMGKALILNYGEVTAMVKIGNQALTVSPGKQTVTDIHANQDGMYGLVVGYQDANKKIVPCYDKFLSSNPRTRKFILLFPGRNSGLRAMTFSEFGPFE